MQEYLSKAVLALGASLATVGMMASHIYAQGTANLINVNQALPAQGTVAVQTNAATLIRTVITLIIVVAALLTLFYLIMGAIAWITSGGDKGKVEEARNKITAAVIGLLILAAVWAIFQLVLTIGFGGTLKTPQFVNTTAPTISGPGYEY